MSTLTTEVDTGLKSAKSVQNGKTFAEFFAGIGLVREALKQSNWRCTYANDIDPKKREIYEANFSDSEEFDERDIWDMEGVLACLKESPFLATCSFPCVDLSVAGNYNGLHGNESSSFFGFTQVLREMMPRPRMILLENVLGFLSSRNGEDFRIAVTELAHLGYRVDAFTINAGAFVPQSRIRVFVVGVHESVKSSLVIRKPARPNFGDPWYRAIDATAALRPKNLRRLMTEIDLKTGWIATPIRVPAQGKHDVRSVIDLGEDEQWWDEEQLSKHYAMMNDRHRAIIDRYVEVGESFVGTGYRRKRQGQMKFEVRFDGMAGCLRTPRGGSARQIVVVVDSGRLKLRWMSPREYGKLQGAGRFKLLENERQMLFGFGDAVCVPVIKWIDTCVLTPIFESQQGATG